jgi:hypothetical protein
MAYGERLLPLFCMSATASCSACGTPFTAAAKAAGSALARNSSAWPVEASWEVYAGPRLVEPGVDLMSSIQ